MANVISLKEVLKNQASGMHSCSDKAECPACGAKVNPIKLVMFGRSMTVSPLCDKCNVALTERKAEEEKRKRQEHIDRLFRLSELGPRFREYTFARWKPRPGAERAYHSAIQFVSQRTQGMQGLLMFGRPGNGKSHLAGGIFNELAELGKTPIFASVPDLLKRLQATFEPDSRTSEHQFYDLLPQADAVILDDLGAEQSRAVGDKHVMTPWAESTLYYIVDCLYRWKKPLVVTTNCDLESLEERISPRTFDRLLEMCLIVENKATSYRKEQAFKRIKELR